MITETNEIQVLNINDINIIITGGFLYTNLDEQICVQISLYQSKDLEILNNFLNTNINISINNFTITGILKEIVHSREQTYIIILERGQYIYG